MLCCCRVHAAESKSCVGPAACAVYVAALLLVVLLCSLFRGRAAVHHLQGEAACLGNSFLKCTHACVCCCCSTDLLALPTCDPDKTFAVQISHEETMVSGPVAFVQCALLHTSSNGERRIR